jgi:hypothetical protein
MSARSATEVVERMKELAQNLGSAFGRLINETMGPLVINKKSINRCGMPVKPGPVLAIYDSQTTNLFVSKGCEIRMQ